MRKLFAFIIVIFLSVSMLAQSPDKMSYQCIVRNSSGGLAINQSVGFRISILQGTTNGTVIYQDTYNPNPQTNANGLLSAEIGSGTPALGIFSNINWATGPYFLKTETDPTGGTNYTIVGTSQLLSVPYAMYAKTAGNGFSGNYNDLTDQPILFTGTWTSLTGKPTTISGYGITDAVNTTDNQTIGGIKTFTNDLSINGLTVGTGKGAVSTNAAFGNQALYSNTTGNSNTATGTQSLFLNTTGYYNTAIGFGALYSNTSSYKNTAIGYDALYFNTSGYKNTASGYAALYSNTTGSENTADGMDALGYNTTGSQNSAAGFQALLSNTIGSANTANGHQALYSNTTGINNTAFGLDALFSNTSGQQNSAIGLRALYSNTTGNGNIAYGILALGRNSTGCTNTAIGNSALFNNTTGWENIAVGDVTLEENTDGGGNIAIGFYSLLSNTTGNDNICIGYGADVSSENLENAIAIGLHARVNASNKIRLGNSDITVIEGQVPFTSASDLRLKKNIKELTIGLDFITKLCPVEYQMKKGDDKINYGFIAQDIEKLVGTNNNLLTIGGDADRTLGLRYTDFIAPMVKAIQEQQVTIREQQKEIDELKGLVKTLIKK